MSDYVTPPGGMTFHLIFDAAADAAPQTFRDGVEQAARLLSQAIANPITVNIKIDYSGTGGSADAKNDGLGAFESYEPMSATEVLSILGATAGSFAPGVGTVIGGLLGGLVGSLLPSSVLPSNFKQNIRQDLIASSSSNLADSLPTGTNSIQGWPFVWVTNTQLKLFGLSAPNDTTTDDASAHFNTDIDPSALVGIALHELTHALGRVPLALGLNWIWRQAFLTCSASPAQASGCLDAATRPRRPRIFLWTAASRNWPTMERPTIRAIFSTSTPGRRARRRRRIQ